MTLFFLTCLLAVFPVISMKSPIFGPQEVNKMEGSSASISCFYPATSVNRHTRKYWCRLGDKGICRTIANSEGYIAKDFTDRVKLTNFPENNTFTVNIANLMKSDSGKYQCGLGINGKGLSFDVSLNISPGLDLSGNQEVHTVHIGGTLSIHCPFKIENSFKIKSLCKKTGSSCVPVKDSTGYEAPEFKDRVNFDMSGGTSARKFTVTIRQVRFSDAGVYQCSAANDATDLEGDKKEFELQVLDPELAYGDLRGSVTFDCPLGSGMANGNQFLCRMGKDANCEVVINTLGQKNEAFQGRVLLAHKDNSRFTVQVTGLQKEDAGRYLCGTSESKPPKDGASTRTWQLFVNEETRIPSRPPVVKGVEGGSVAVLCPYNPKKQDSLKYWCRWKDTKNGDCSLLVQSEGLVDNDYRGRLALSEEPRNGSFTIMLNQLTAEDAGFYWCVTSNDDAWTTVVELKVVQAAGEPNLKVPKDISAVEGEPLQLSCHVACRYFSFEKYWCKWTEKGCNILPSKDAGPSQAFVNCNQQSKLITLVLNPFTKQDEGWYWCGVKDGSLYRETTAVRVTVTKKVKVAQDVKQVNTVLSKEVQVPSGNKIDNKAIQDPSLIQQPRIVQGPRIIQDPSPEDRAVKDSGNREDGRRAFADTSSSVGQGRSSTVLVSTLVPLGLVLAAGAMALAVARARHRRNVDRVSIRSFRTDISMSDLENSRDFGGNDNVGASPDNQETSLERKDESVTTTEKTVETEERKKAKRSSKEEADMAYTAFLLQSNTLAARVHDGPSEA